MEKLLLEIPTDIEPTTFESHEAKKKRENPRIWRAVGRELDKGIRRS
jgi:hypothetical protein